jgi:hypothetical protein
MMKLALTLFAAAAFTAPALATTPIAFVWEGHKFVGTVDTVNGMQLIKGEDLTSGRTFELRVTNGYVNGTVGDEVVSYPVPKHKIVDVNAG